MKIQILETPPVAENHREVLAVGTIHQTVKPPKGEAGTWVQGDREPVKLFPREYKDVR